MCRNTRLESLIRMLAIRAYIRFRGLAWQERTEERRSGGHATKNGLALERRDGAAFD